MPFGKGPCGALAVNEHALPPPVNEVLFCLGNIVADVVHDLNVFRTDHPLEGFAHPVRHHLPVGKGEVRGRSHRVEIVLPFSR